MVVNSRKRYRKVLATALALAVALTMILSLNVQPVFSSTDGYTYACIFYDDYGQCVVWGLENEAGYIPITPTPTPANSVTG